MTSENGRHYYEEKLAKLITEYEKHEEQLALVLVSYFDESKTRDLLREVRNSVEALIAELPYLGGDENPATQLVTQILVGSAYSLLLFLALEREGISMRDMAKIVYRVEESIAQLTPPETRRQIGEFYFTGKMMDMVRTGSETSVLRKYPEDWVYEFLEGDGQTFDYGYNMTECGIIKLYRKHKAERFAPILCLMDYASYGSLGVGFKRTQKLAAGDPHCDFRFQQDHETPRGWPPDELEEKFPF